MSLSANLAAALAGSRHGAFWLFRVTVAGTNYQYGSAPYASNASGQFDDKIIEIGTVNQRLPEWRGGIASGSLEVVISDVDRSWGKLVEGASGRSVRDAAATMFLAHPDVAEADWFIFFSGEVATWGWPAPGQVKIKVRNTDRPLRYDVPKSGWILSQSDWLNSPQDSIGLLAPVIYGTHDSAQTTQEGAVPCIYVDTVAWKWLICAGHTKEVMNVYVDGEKQVVSDYTVSYPLVRGRRYTIVTFDSDPGAGETVDVTADVRGYDTNADGTGTLIEDPPDVLAHFLSNFVYADWMDGAWNSTHAVIDTTSFGTTYFSDRSSTASAYISERQRGSDHMDSLAVSFGASIYWGLDNKLRFVVQTPQELDIYSATSLPWDAQVVVPASTDQPEDRATSITCKYGPDASRDEYSHSLSVRAAYVEDEQPDNTEMSWGTSQ